MTFDAIVLAAGASDRFGGAAPKQFARLAGVPIVVRAVRAAVLGGASRVVVVVGRDRLEEAEALLRGETGAPISFVAGGATRVDSCRLGLASLAALGGEVASGDVVVVHDAARPLASAALFERVVAAIRAGADGATVATASADTVARLVDGDLAEVLDRSSLARLQTPQGFRREVLVEAHERAALAGDTAATDDCGLVLRYVPEARIAAVPGEDRNIKVTTRADLDVAEHLLAQG